MAKQSGKREGEERSERAPNYLAIGLFLLILVLAIAVCIVAYNFWKAQQQPVPPPPPTVATQAATAPLPPEAPPPPADLVSDDRIIFGGIPRPHDPALQVTILKNLAYMVGYSEARKDPLWSAYRVFHKVPPFVLERPKGDFLTDMRTQARVAHHDYTGAGYDRGHMTPNSAIARCYGAEAQKETFLLSNICPQAPHLNREVWEKLEQEEQVYAERFEEVWVMDGPIFADQNGGTTHTLRSGIAIPSSFYKIVLEDEGGGAGGVIDKVKLFCVIMPQGVKGTELPGQFMTSLRAVEDQSGLEFLWKVDGATRATLENQTERMW